MARKNALVDKTCWRLELAYDPMPARTTWKFIPRYRYRHEGDSVVYNDEILITNHKYNAYLHFTTFLDSDIILN